MTPCSVMGVDCLAAAVSVATLSRSVGLARPKSRSFARADVSMMFPGFNSRCTTLLRCALSSASAICIRISTRAPAAAPRFQPLRPCLPFDAVHHQVVQAGLIAPRHTTRRCADDSSWRWSLLRVQTAASELGSLENFAGRILIATVRSSRVSRAR